jgi:hypothetical protein
MVEARKRAVKPGFLPPSPGVQRDRMSTLRTAVSTSTWGGDVRNRAEAGEEGRLLAALAAGDRQAAERLVERT